MTRTPFDPITFELIKNTFGSIVDEMALIIVRTAYSGVVKDVMDFSTALCDAEGRMIAQGLTIPLHLGSIPDAMVAVLEKYGRDIHPGDAYVLNDPFQGGMHLPDIFDKRAGSRPRPLRCRPCECAPPDDPPAARSADRSGYFGRELGTIAMPVRVRSGLRNRSVSGPLVIQEYDTSVVVPPGCSASLDAIGNILSDVSAP